MAIFDDISDRISQRSLLAILIDPDKIEGDNDRLISHIAKSDVDLVLVGGSLIFSDIDSIVQRLKERISKPVILFPGLSSHFTSKVDAVLFLSLLSGRNPDFLIGNQVHAAIPILRSGVEVIPTAYILVDGGRTTSVEYMSNTKPIPANKPDIALATAAAAQLMGFKMLYLEAGSGAEQHVPYKTIQTIKRNISLPIIVGGGIRTEKALCEVLSAGADVVVVGTAFEEDYQMIDRFCEIVQQHRRCNK